MSTLTAPTGLLIGGEWQQTQAKLQVMDPATFTVLGYTERAVCYSTTVPQGQNLVVTNINNGQSIKCLSVYSTLVPPGIAIVLHQSVFVKLSDLIDAPIPVKVTW